MDQLHDHNPAKMGFRTMAVNPKNAPRYVIALYHGEAHGDVNNRVARWFQAVAFCPRGRPRQES
jgi:hypothetical protein